MDGLAHILGISYADLLELNPALVRGVTPADGSPYSVRVPPGKKDILLAGLRNIPEDKTRSQIVHVVKKGDTVKGIIRQYGVPKEMLVQLNPDVNLSRRLKRGVKDYGPQDPCEKEGGVQDKWDYAEKQTETENFSKEILNS